MVARNSDLDTQKPQKLIAHAIVPIIIVVNTFVRMDPQAYGEIDGTTEIVNQLMKAISMMAKANDIDHVRRNSVKPGLNADIDLVPLTKCRHQKFIW